MCWLAYSRMDLFKEFVASPSVELLKGLKAEELWRVVTHYNLTPDVIQGRSKKKEVFAALHMGLIDQGVLEDDETSSPVVNLFKPKISDLDLCERSTYWRLEKKRTAQNVFPIKGLLLSLIVWITCNSLLGFF